MVLPLVWSCIGLALRNFQAHIVISTAVDKTWHLVAKEAAMGGTKLSTRALYAHDTSHRHLTSMDLVHLEGILSSAAWI